LSTKAIKTIVFTDLDGSLLNDKYEYEEIEPVLCRLLTLNIPIIFSSSKTRREIEFYRTKMKIRDPFIAENGAVIIIPKNYFKISYGFSKQLLDYNMIELGMDYRSIRKKIFNIEDQIRAHVIGFGDMTVEDLAKESGLSLDLALLAKKREYSEPFRIIDDDEKRVLQAITKAGLCYTKGGRYFHALGNCDKGKAASILKDLYAKQFNRIFTIGIGDSDNDMEMLKIVDKPFYVNKTMGRNAIWKEIELIARASLK
jgi:mannosyl-3-phosphoglycerate phosphatase